MKVAWLLILVVLAVESFSPRIECRRKTSSLISLASKDTVNDVASRLHQVSIEAISRALEIRARNDPSMPLQEPHEPIDIVMTAGRIAAETIGVYREEYQYTFSPEEEQTIAGRAVAVIMRFTDLEETLIAKVESFQELSTAFGITESEKEAEEIKTNDDFRQRRAESLLAIFLDTIEGPGLQQSGATVPGGSDVTFLDEERAKVLLKGESNDTPEPEEKPTKRTGDKLRDATGIRPSLHPMTINAIAEGLKIRAQKKQFSPLRLIDDVEPYDIMMTAGKIAENAIMKRQKSSRQDDMSLTKEEEGTVAGRIVAVLTRLDELEEELHSKCLEQAWIAKYNEWGSFGVLKDESDPSSVDQRVLDDPLFAMSRAECLLALFLHTIEGPGFAQSGHEAPGGSAPDFIDSERRDVLLT